MRVIQGIIIHDVIGRPKVMLDQLAEGLNALGFRAAMKEYPEFLEALFIPSKEELNADSMIGVLQFPKDMDDNASVVAGYIYMFIQNAKVDTRFSLLPQVQRLFPILAWEKFKSSLIGYRPSLHQHVCFTLHFQINSKTKIA